MAPGLSMQANNLDDSSNHGAGDVGLGPEDSEITNFINPRITYDHPLNTLSVQTYSFDNSEAQMKHTPNPSPISPNLPEASSNVARYSPSLQQPDTSHLLQVPELNTPHKRPLSPSSKLGSELGNMNNTSTSKYFSKRSTKSKPMASAKKAEEVSEELASEITNCITLHRGSPGHIHATIKDRLLLTFNPVLSQKRSAQTASLKDNLHDGKRRRITCDQCSATTARECDMRKHKKRHTRPYGCTFTGCSKKLGSKNDWKRHENTQHYQIETWRCHEHSKTSAIGQCASIFYRREQFQGHLREKHGIEDDEYIREQCKRHRIGRNGQSAFWCGFCKQIVELKTKGLEAWEERFSHIDNLHYKKGQTIYDWVPLDGDLPKGLKDREGLAEGERREDNDDHSEGSRSSEDDADDGSAKQSTPDKSSPKLAQNGVACSRRTSAGRANGAEYQAATSKRVKIWYCVSRLGYFSGGTTGELISAFTDYSAGATKAPTESTVTSYASNAPIKDVPVALTKRAM
ncbi:MAG: hypothetical protein Q9225_002108 [Loekoesia sp. 1 TL-2023]